MPRQPIPALGLATLALLSLAAGLCFSQSSAAQEAQKGGTEHAPAAATKQTTLDEAVHSAEAHGEAGERPDIFEPQPALAGWTIVVFAGLLLILGKFAWKPLIAALHQREEHLEHVLLETERARNEGEQLLAEHRRRLAASEEQIRAMFDQAKKDAQTLADEIVKKAGVEAEAQKERATREIVAARDQALAEISTKTADLAVSVAGKVLGKSVTGEEHRRLIEAAVAELPAAPNGRAHASGGRTA